MPYYFCTRHERGSVDLDYPVPCGVVSGKTLKDACEKAAAAFRIRKRDLIDLEQAEAHRVEEAKQLMYKRLEDNAESKRLMERIAAGRR